MPKLRDFTQHDWDGFAGCESDKPMMGECIVVHTEDDGKDYDYGALVILDGSTVQIHCIRDHHGTDKEITFHREFESDSDAEIMAKGIGKTVRSKLLLVCDFQRIIG